MHQQNQHRQEFVDFVVYYHIQVQKPSEIYSGNQIEISPLVSIRDEGIHWFENCTLSLPCCIYDHSEWDLSKYEYIRIEEWSSQPISPSDNWRFYWPTRKREYFKMYKMDDYEVYTPEINSEVVRNKSYWGLDRIVRYSEDLTEINANNVDEKIFKRFDLIKNI